MGLWFRRAPPLSIPDADRLWWLEPTTYQPLTGASPYAATGWNDLWGLRNFTTLSGGPDIVDPSTVFFKGGRRMEFVQANQDCLAGPGIPADYAAFSNGLKATFACSFLATDVDTTMILGATGNTGVGQIDSFWRIDNVNERVTLGIGNDVERALSIISPIGSVPAGSAHTVVTEFGNLTPGVGNSGIDDFTMRIDGRLIQSGELDSTVITDLAPPQSVMTLGRRGGQVTEFYGGVMWHNIAAKNFYGRRLSLYLESLRV